METISLKPKNALNFHDYLFIRRTLFGWQQCHSSDQYIAKDHFRCAFRLAIPQKYQVRLALPEVYNAGLHLSNDHTNTMLDYLTYLRTLYTAYIFAIFGSPRNNRFLERAEFIKALREDRLPNDFEEKEVNNFYYLISKNPLHLETQMNFETWCFFFNLHRLFQKYSKARRLHLNKKELMNLLNDKFTPIGTVNAIDVSLTNFKRNDYKEASLYLQRKVPQESEFYYSFKEPLSHASKIVTNLAPTPKHHLTTKLNKKGNKISREYFFTIMSDVDTRLLD